MDNKNADMVRAINMLPYAEILREQELFVCETHREYWNVTNRIARDQSIGKPRILICGSSGVGKSSLINEFLGESAVRLSVSSYSLKYELTLCRQKYLMGLRLVNTTSIFLLEENMRITYSMILMDGKVVKH